MKLSEVFELFLEYKKPYVKLSSYATYQNAIDSHLKPELKDVDNELKEDRVQQFVLSLFDKGLSIRTIREYIILLKTILKWANKNKLFKSDLDWTLEYPKGDNLPKMSVYSDEQIMTVVNFLFKNLSFKNLGILTAFYTGMRIGEISGLKWKDIDIDLGIIKINRNVQRITMRDENNPTGKKVSKLIVQSPKTTCSEREIPLSADLQLIYSRLKPCIDEDNYIFSNSRIPIEPRAIRGYFNNVIKYLNLPYLKFHGIRHSFATKLIRDKADIKTVSALLGHSDVSITLNLYVHPDMDQKKNTLNNSFKSLI